MEIRWIKHGNTVDIVWKYSEYVIRDIVWTYYGFSMEIPWIQYTSYRNTRYVVWNYYGYSMEKYLKTLWL